jgi:hypothetical protein
MLTMLYETGHPWLCFSGDTKVAVADGRNAISIKELAESNIPIPVYSARPVSKNALNFKNKSQRYWTEEIKMATAFKTGRRELIRIHLDDGSFFRCTEDHLLALKNGGYIRADLSAGHSLFPFNSWNDITHPNNCYIGRNQDPRQRQARMIWEFYNGEVPKGYVVDHVLNGEGDYIKNLQLLQVNTHNQKTATERMGENNPFFGRSHSNETRQKISAITKNRMTSKYREYLSNKLKGKEKPDRYGLSKADLISEGRKFYVKYGTLSNLVWRKHFREERLPSCGYVLNRFRKWSLFIDSCVNNHKVVRIEKIGEFEDVYDLSVEDNHNFFIITHETEHFNSGVLVHNCFKDPCNLRSPQQHVGVVHSSNLCTEICLNTSFQEIAVCNLASINLAAHIREGQLDLDKLQRTIRMGMRMLDNVIDINYYSVPQAKAANLRHRPVGLGTMGFQDVLYQLRIPYASEQAVEFADYTQEVISYYAILASTELAQERGHYSTFNGSLWSQGILPIDSINLLAKVRGHYLDMSTTMTLDWDSLRERVKTVGMRNSNCMAIAPTATISLICGVSQSIEPIYQNLFVKSNLSGEFTIINPYLVRDLKARGLWDEVMVNDLKYGDGSVREIERIPQDLQALYATAFEIDPSWLVEAASRRQKWLDQSQSLNLYMLEPSGRKLDQLYRLAWLRGLKTTYYLRSLGATRVQKSTVSHFNTTSNIPQACALEDPECEACQ